MKRIVINGFGRIGKIAFKLLMQNKDYEVVAINSHSTPEEIAYMLKYDSIYHSFNNFLISDNFSFILYFLVNLGSLFMKNLIKILSDI